MPTNYCRPRDLTVRTILPVDDVFLRHVEYDVAVIFEGGGSLSARTYDYLDALLYGLLGIRNLLPDGVVVSTIRVNISNQIK